MTDALHMFVFAVGGPNGTQIPLAGKVRYQPTRVDLCYYIYALCHVILSILCAKGLGVAFVFSLRTILPLDC